MVGRLPKRTLCERNVVDSERGDLVGEVLNGESP